MSNTKLNITVTGLHLKLEVKSSSDGIAQIPTEVSNAYIGDILRLARIAYRVICS